MSGAIRLQPLYAFKALRRDNCILLFTRVYFGTYSSAICSTKPPIQVICSKYHIYLVQGINFNSNLRRSCTARVV